MSSHCRGSLLNSTSTPTGTSSTSCALELNPTEQLKAAATAKQELTDEMRSDVEEAHKLLQQAIQDRSFTTPLTVSTWRVSKVRSST